MSGPADKRSTTLELESKQGSQVRTKVKLRKISSPVQILSTHKHETIR